MMNRHTCSGYQFVVRHGYACDPAHLEPPCIMRWVTTAGGMCMLLHCWLLCEQQMGRPCMQHPITHRLAQHGEATRPALSPFTHEPEPATQVPVAPLQVMEGAPAGDGAAPTLQVVGHTKPPGLPLQVVVAQALALAGAGGRAPVQARAAGGQVTALGMISCWSLALVLVFQVLLIISSPQDSSARGHVWQRLATTATPSGFWSSNSDAHLVVHPCFARPSQGSTHKDSTHQTAPNSLVLSHKFGAVSLSVITKLTLHWRTRAGESHPGAWGAGTDQRGSAR